MVQAEWIAPDFSGNAFGAAMAKIYDEIKEVIWTAAKKAAISSVAEEVGRNISTGANGSPMWITDWRDTLSAEPKRVTRLQMKNFFSKLGGGKNGNYVSSSGGSGAGGIISNAENAVMDMTVPQLINLAEYGASDPSEVFSQNNFRAFMAAYGSSGKNIGNGIEATLLGYDKKASLDEENEKIASVQAQAYRGFGPTMQNGKVITPGSTIGDILSAAQTMSISSLANAKTIQEVAGALVARVVSKAVHKGIGGARETVNQATGMSLTSRDFYQTYQAAATAYGNINQEQ